MYVVQNLNQTTTLDHPSVVSLHTSVRTERYYSNSSVEEKLGGKMMIIKGPVTTVMNQLKEALDFTKRKQPILKGTSFSPSNLQEYLKEHIIVEGDKNGTMNIASVKYVREAEGHMLERFNRSRVYQRLAMTIGYPKPVVGSLRSNLSFCLICHRVFLTSFACSSTRAKF